MPAETPGASQEGTLAIELFLMENYRFRRNILNGKVEFAVLPKADNKAEGNTVDNLDSLSIASEEAELDYRPLTQGLPSSDAGGSQQYRDSCQAREHIGEGQSEDGDYGVCAVGRGA